MRTAAQLLGKLSHLHNTHALAVLFTEKGHCAGLLGLLYTHYFRLNSQILRYLFIDNLLYLLQLLSCHRCGMGEIKPGSFAVLIGTCLFHMIAQHFPQGFLQQMRRAVVPACTASSRGIHCQNGSIAHLNPAPRHSADMSHLAAKQFYGVLNLKFSVARGDHADVAFLAAHCGIKGRPLHDHRADVTFQQFFRQLCLGGKHRNFRITGQLVITNKFRGNGRVYGLVHGHIRAHVIGHLAGRSGFLLLLLHTYRKAVLIHRKALLLQNLSGQIKREAKGIVELKSVRAAKLLPTALFYRFRHLI